MSTQFPDDDPLATRLRGALNSEADMVQTSDNGLQQIRERIGESRRPWWQHPAPLSIAAALVLGVAAGGLAVALNDGDNGKVVTGGGSSHTASPTASDTGSPEPTSSGSESPPPAQFEGDVFVYYVMDDQVAGPRLYREEHPGTGASPAVAAVTEAVSASPMDSDYSSPWPHGTKVLSLDVQGDVATVDLNKFVSVGSAAENVAVQQLVYTVTANDKSVKKVQLLVNGKAPQSGHEDWSQPVARAPMLDVQGLIWLLAPAQDATVSSPVQIDGYGTAFEGTVSWEVYADGGKGAKVADGFTMGGGTGEFGEFHDTVDLQPGTYELRAFESSAEDGRPLHVDTKTFTVR